MVGVAQRLEHWTVTPGVGGSNPLVHPNFFLLVWRVLAAVARCSTPPVHPFPTRLVSMRQSWLTETKTAILLLILVATAFSRLHSLTEPLPIDLSIYGYMGHQILAGDPLYSILWDHKPPGIYWTFMLAELFWGYGPEAVVYLGLLFTLAGVLFIYLFVGSIASAGTALLAALFFALSSNSLFLEANQPNVETFLNAFTLVGLWGYVRSRAVSKEAGGGGASYLIVCGAAFALATAFKMVAVFPLFSIFVYEFFSPASGGSRLGAANIKRLVMLGVPVAALWVALFSWFALIGDFSDFFEAVFAYNSRYSEGVFSSVWKMLTSPTLLFNMGLKEVWVLVLISLLWPVMARASYGPVGRGFFFLLAAGLAVEVGSPGKYFFHYYHLYLPLVATLSALFVADHYHHLEVRRRALARLATAITVAFIVANLGYYHVLYLAATPEENSVVKYGTEYVEVVELAGYVRENTASCESVYSWGEEAGVYFYSKRRASSGLFFVFAMFFDAPEEKERKLKALLEDLRADPPALFVVEDRHKNKLDVRIKFLLAESYDFKRRFDKYTVYELRDGRRGCGGSSSL